MIALFAASALTVDGADLPVLGKAVEACDRGGVAKAVKEEMKRHSAFLLDSFEEEQAIVAARLDLADRRHKLRAGGGAAAPGDTEQSLALGAQGLADRQQALDDARTLDRLKGEAISYFRQAYISQCQGKGA